MLCEYNRQRVKSLPEVTREEIVFTNIDPEESHQLLMERREQEASIDAPNAIEIEGDKHRAEITEAKQPFLDAINAVLEKHEDFWPISVRRIHYGLLNDPPLIHASKPGSYYSNTLASYKALVDLASRARVQGLLPWNAIDDETRPVTTWKTHPSIATFLREELDSFLIRYFRNYQKSQPNHVEILAEKNTVKSIVWPVAQAYCINASIGRGYTSLPPRQKMAERFRKSGKEKLIVIVVADCDPEGEDIPHSFARSMRDDFGIEEEKIVVLKAALTPAQAVEMNLPPIMKAKKKSSRRKRFVEQYGDDVFELEAIDPRGLQRILRSTIESVLDMNAFRAEVDAEKRDSAYLAALRRTVQQQLGGLHLEEGSSDANPLSAGSAGTTKKGDSNE